MMRLYRVLLHLYPAAFRHEYGPELCAAFAARRRDASSILGRLALWLEVLPDLLLTALLTHWDILRQDLRLAVRALRRAPGFTLTVVIVAALGVGANTAVFSVTDHVLVRPLPFERADELVRIWEDQSFRGYPQMEPSPAAYRDWKRASTAFTAMGAYTGTSVNMIGQGTPERLDGVMMTADLLPALGVQAALGRVFTPDDDRAGAPNTVLLSDRLWRSRFGADPQVIGRKIVLDNEAYDVIGVMPPAFVFPGRSIALWTPLRLTERHYEDRSNQWLYVIGRLTPGVSIEAARAQMRTIGEQIAREHRESERVGVAIDRLRDQVSARTRTMLLALVGASIGVLLIACTNLANLLLARALVRRKELALRTALGAGRERLVRQLLTESLLLAAAGGILGVWLAHAGTPLLTRLVPTSLPISDVPPLDLRVLSIGALITVLTGIGFGVLPAARACGRLDAAVLQEGSRGGVGGRRERLRNTLVIAAIAVSVMLSIGSGLLIRALWRVQSTDPGFRADGVLTLLTWLPVPKYRATAARTDFYTRVLTDVRALPGVTSAAYVGGLPMVMRGGVFPVRIEGEPPDAPETHAASMRFVTPGFFETMGTPLRLGRDVSDADTTSTQTVAVVSESFVRNFLAGQNPIGRRFAFGANIQRTIVGVVGDIRVRGLERVSEPQVYLPSRQMADGSFPLWVPKSLVIRATGDVAALAPAVRAIVGRVDAAQPIEDVRLLTEVVAEDTAPRVTQVRVLGVFAAIAFLLAGIGIHGLLSFAVSHRAQEIGVRMAMGAQSRDILGMILRDGVVLAVIGITLGVGLAYAAGRSLEAMLAGVSPWDLTTFAAGVAVSLAMTLAGSLLPALRALAVDPLTVMRTE